MKNHFAALKFREEVGDKSGIASSLNNIGIIYDLEENYNEALIKYWAAFKLYEETGNKNGIGISYVNMAGIYEHQKNYSGAMSNLFKALKIREEMGDQDGIAIAYGEIGIVYLEQDNYQEALKNERAAIKIFKEIENKDGIARTYLNLSAINAKLEKYGDSKAYLNDALLLSKEMGSNENISNSYIGLAEMDSATGNWKDAYVHQKLYIIYRDSLINENNTKKTVQMQMQYEFDKKETITKAAQDKKDAIAQVEVKRQKNIRNSTFAGLAGVFIFSIIVYRQRNKISKEKKRSDELLLNILPAETAEELKNTGTTKAKDFDEVTVLFTDFKNFTKMSEQLSAQDLVNEINYCYSAFDNIITKYGIEKIKTMGDSYMCAGGLPVANKTNAEDTVKAALEIRDFMLTYATSSPLAKSGEAFEIRIGLHTGPVVAGIVGIKKYSYDIWGDTVNIASRMESSGEPGKVNISGSTYELVKDKFTCTYRGKIEAKNKGEIDMYFVQPLS